MNESEISQNKPLVLLVDDDAIARFQFKYILEREGYRVMEAMNGAEGLALYAQEAPDIVLLDALMPEMDGFECCQALRRLPDNHSAPILIITALEDKESVDQAFAVGATDYITKPIHWAVLRQRMRRLVEQFWLQQEQALLYKRLAEANQVLQRLALIDELTQVANRRWFDTFLQQEWQRLGQMQRPLGLILCDVDYFKSYNDTYGHLAGDRCLRQVAAALQKAVHGAANLVARYGGEEFAVILPETTLADATQVASLIQRTVRSLQLPHAQSIVCNHITLSFGVASIIPRPFDSSATVIDIADRRLFHAKSIGRDRIVSA